MLNASGEVVLSANVIATGGQLDENTFRAKPRDQTAWLRLVTPSKLSQLGWVLSNILRRIPIQAEGSGAAWIAPAHHADEAGLWVGLCTQQHASLRIASPAAEKEVSWGSSAR